MVNSIIQFIIQTRTAPGSPRALPCPGPSLHPPWASSGPPWAVLWPPWALPCASRPLGLGVAGPGPWAQGSQKPMTAAKITNDRSQKKPRQQQNKNNKSSSYQRNGGNIGPTGLCALPLLGPPWAHPPCSPPWALPGPPTRGPPSGLPMDFPCSNHDPIPSPITSPPKIIMLHEPCGQ